MAGTSRKLGPRATVLFINRKTAKGKKKKGSLYVFMLRRTAEYFGFKVTDRALVRNKKGEQIAVRGCIGGATIKVPTAIKSKTTSGSTFKYKSIPVPSDATITEIQSFLKTATKNKPKYFVGPGGRTYGMPDASR